MLVREKNVFWLFIKTMKREEKPATLVVVPFLILCQWMWGKCSFTLFKFPCPRLWSCFFETFYQKTCFQELNQKTTFWYCRMADLFFKVNSFLKKVNFVCQSLSLLPLLYSQGTGLYSSFCSCMEGNINSICTRDLLGDILWWFAFVLPVSILRLFNYFSF